ncbi:hypothetical protein [Evansella tamaricis]|uniref:Uncharacterized protein n=1 Tax=Evansella tamaricis TaxID=2069301 RepID=A0ABS6JK72_9BACI|nr:hypothetical protein [Evansella tamaricis]MBU9714094.1 hypothetical protein [Evansella tamaricis]
MTRKEKGLYLGAGFLIGLGLGLVSFSTIKLTNIGNVDKFIIVNLNDQPVHQELEKNEKA